MLPDAALLLVAIGRAVAPEIQCVEDGPVAQRICHVWIDQPYQRDIARHRVVAHHMVDTLALHDDATQLRTAGKGVTRRCPDKRHIA